MRSLDPPNIGADDLYDEVSSMHRSEDRRVRLDAIRGEVFAAYRLYEDLPEPLTGLPHVAVDDLQDADLKRNYRVLRDRQKQVYQWLLNRTPWGTCPMCNERTAATIDHYLPASKWPEFSILPLNLVPACSDCNQDKRDHHEASGHPLFVHHYVDPVEAHGQFLFADVDVTNGLVDVVFRLAINDSMPQAVAHRIGSQYERLGFATFFRTRALHETASRLLSIRMDVDDGASPGSVRHDLLRDRGSWAATAGLNHWKCATLEALAASDEICRGEFADPLP